MSAQDSVAFVIDYDLGCSAAFANAKVRIPVAGVIFDDADIMSGLSCFLFEHANTAELWYRKYSARYACIIRLCTIALEHIGCSYLALENRDRRKRRALRVGRVAGSVDLGVGRALQVGVDLNALVTCLDIGCGQVKPVNCRDAARAVPGAGACGGAGRPGGFLTAAACL